MPLKKTIYKYCEVMETGPGQWVALTDTSVEVSDKSLLDTLNYLGRHGWRLVTAVSFQTATKRFYLEREIIDWSDTPDEKIE